MATSIAAVAQDRPPGPPPEFVSPQVGADRKIAFRLHAPKAEAVRLSSSDIPGATGVAMKKGDGGVWEATVGPVPAGAYRYTFNVDGLTVVDPKNFPRAATPFKMRLRCSLRRS